MSRQDQDPHDRPSTYHSQFPSGFSTAQQSEQPTPPLSTTQVAYSPYVGGRLPYPPSHQLSDHSSTGPTANYSPQPATHNPSLGFSTPHQDISGGSFPAAQSPHHADPQPAQSSDPYGGYHYSNAGYQTWDTAGGSAYSNSVSSVSSSVTAGAGVYSGAQSHPGGYTPIGGRSQDWETARRDSSYDDRLYSRGPPVNGRPVIHFCQYPHCGRHGFYDHRVNTYMEWCHEHLPSSVANNLCVQCGIYPRQSGCRFCGGDRCQYTRYGS